MFTIDDKVWQSYERRFNTWAERNINGIELEKTGELDKAVELYEQNIKESCDTPHSYDRLAIIYRKKLMIDKEIEVLEKAIIVLQDDKYFMRLEKAKILQQKIS
jgi:tetratricopeptide (TPR) repeat protein